MGVTRVLLGDLFGSSAQTLVNTVNCVGVMGKGIALEFKTRFPDMYRDYEDLCRRGEMRLGRPHLYRHLTQPWVLLFPTKDHWRSVARLDDIVRGLECLKSHYREWGITSLAVPPLGCGQGKLDWHIVGPTLYRHLQGLDIPVELYAPYGTPAAELTPEFLADAEPQRTLFSGSDLNKQVAAWLAVVDILHRVETHPYHWPVGRVIFHKILYFATEAGLATGLQFSPGSYGPYSAAAEPLVSKLINNGLIVESKSGRMFPVQVGPAFADARRAYAAQMDASSVIQERVADLFLRVNTHQAEVAATVHYTATHLLSLEAESSEKDVLLRVMQWKQRRQPQWSEEEVAITIRYLNMLGWVKVKGSRDLPLPQDS
jgi:uncharacterized protein YwgA/O-acetyl-ADP-ribose deacetylase (regulator of RNase III)